MCVATLRGIAYRHLLVAYDGTSEGDEAIIAADLLAQRDQSRLTIAVVVELEAPLRWVTRWPRGTSVWNDVLLDRARADLERAARLVEVQAELTVLFGPPTGRSPTAPTSLTATRSCSRPARDAVSPARTRPSGRNSPAHVLRGYPTSLAPNGFPHPASPPPRRTAWRSSTPNSITPSEAARAVPRTRLRHGSVFRSDRGRALCFGDARVRGASPKRHSSGPLLRRPGAPADNTPHGVTRPLSSTGSSDAARHRCRSTRPPSGSSPPRTVAARSATARSSSTNGSPTRPTDGNNGYTTPAHASPCRRHGQRTRLNTVSSTPTVSNDSPPAPPPAHTPKGLLEPDPRKRARPVLKEAGRSNTLGLPDSTGCLSSG